MIKVLLMKDQKPLGVVKDAFFSFSFLRAKVRQDKYLLASWSCELRSERRPVVGESMSLRESGSWASNQTKQSAPDRHHHKGSGLAVCRTSSISSN